MATKALITVEEFARMTTPETEDYELVDGELIPLASANPMHAFVRGVLEHMLRSFFERNPCGQVFAEIDCQTTAGRVRRPDLAIFVAAKVKDMDRTKIPVPFAPDIAVEVLSPSETVVDVHRKALEYLAGGSQEVWQIDYENSEVFIQSASGIRLLRDGAESVLDSGLLPGFAAPLARLFAGF